MTDPVFTGVGVALVTLFDDDRQLDHDATGKLAAQLVELGATAIVAAGTTGEADALDDDERLGPVRLGARRGARHRGGRGHRRLVGAPGGPGSVRPRATPASTP